MINRTIGFNVGRLLAIVMLLLFAVPQVRAEWNDSIRWKAEAEADFGGGQHNPLWIASDNFGVTSINKNSGYVRVGAFHDLDKSKRFSWGAGLDLVAGWNQLAPFKIQQAYGEVKYRCLNAMIGQKEQRNELLDTEIGQGSMLYSGNAMPVPQVRIGIFDYADVWGCKGWFGIKGYIAYGKYTDSRFMHNWVGDNSKRLDGALYHSKGIWFRIGNEKKFPLTYEFGLEMVTQFGGSSYMRYNSSEYKWFKLPSGFVDWIKAFIPMGSASDSDFAGEIANIQGNMFGEWNFSLKWNPQEDWDVTLYYHHYFEDHSMLFMDYPWKDGLIGVKGTFPKNRFVSKACYEFLYTKEQSGPILSDWCPEIPEQVSGGDSYFNNMIYQGWQNWGMGVGTPLIISPVYNNPHSIALMSTRVVAHHVGFAGEPFKDIRYRVKLSHISSWGKYGFPYDKVKHNFSGLLEVGWKPSWLNGWEGALAIAGDTGDLIGDSFGVKIRISKTGWLFKSKK